MFLTIGLIVGFVLGWYVNEKFEDLASASAKLKFWKKQCDDGGFRMFTRLRRWFDEYKKFLFESYESPKPTVYKIGKKKFVKVKRIRTAAKSKGPYLK